MENTVLAYTLTGYSLSNQKKEPEVYQHVPVISKVLKPPLECNEKALKPSRLHYFTGLSVNTKCGVKLRCHFVISSYITDKQESKDCLSFEQGILTSLPCPRCATPKFEMDQLCQYPSRNVQDILPILSAFQCQQIKV